MSRRFPLAVVLASATALVAQAQQTQIQNPQARQAGAAAQAGGAQIGQAGQAGALNNAIAACLALGNQEEVALAQFASSRAKNAKVKEFAAMMQRQHTEALQKLQRIAPQLASWNLELTAGTQTSGQGQGGAQQAGAQQAGGQQFGQTGGVQQAGNIQAIDGQTVQEAQLLALQRTVAQQCLDLTQRELEQAENFDECYIGQQVGAHIGMLAKLRGSQQFAAGEVRTYIDEATRTVEGHLQHAKQLAKELKTEAAANASAQRSAGGLR